MVSFWQNNQNICFDFGGLVFPSVPSKQALITAAIRSFTGQGTLRKYYGKACKRDWSGGHGLGFFWDLCKPFSTIKMM
jgi:hypothetical protein